jgi:hypothetical protein
LDYLHQWNRCGGCLLASPLQCQFQQIRPAAFARSTLISQRKNHCGCARADIEKHPGNRTNERTTHAASSQPNYFQFGRALHVSTGASLSLAPVVWLFLPERVRRLFSLSVSLCHSVIGPIADVIQLEGSQILKAAVMFRRRPRYYRSRSHCKSVPGH